MAIKLICENGSRTVETTAEGAFLAVHLAVDFEDVWTITHKSSGKNLRLRFTDPDAAIMVMQRLELHSASPDRFLSCLNFHLNDQALAQICDRISDRVPIEAILVALDIGKAALDPSTKALKLYDLATELMDAIAPDVSTHSLLEGDHE